MPVPTESVLLGINDCKITALESDDSTATIYASTSVDVPGITELKVSPNFVEKELKGDEVILDMYSKLESVNWSISHAKMSLDALAIMLGGTVTNNTLSQTYSLTGDDVAGYFKLEAKTDYTETGDAHFILYKAKANSVEYTLTGEEYATVTASGKAIPTIFDKKLKDIVFNEEATDIS